MNIVLNGLYYIILGAPNAFFHLLIWNKLDDKNKIKHKWIYLISISVLALVFSLIHDYVSSMLRIVLILAALVIAYLILHNKNMKQALVSSTYTLGLLMVGELLFGIIYLIINKTTALEMLDGKLTNIIMNLCISLIAYGLYNITIFKKFYEKLNKLFSKLSNGFILVFAILILFSVNFAFLTSYYKIDFKWLILINTIISAVYLIIVFKIFNVENKIIKINAKYNTTLTNLKEYEEILDKYKIMNHENKNDLLMISSMIIKKENNIDKYIDKLIDTKIKDDEKLMYETSIIPSGGLRAVIYSKLLIMKDKKISSVLHVDKKVRSVDLSDYGEEFVIDLCKIVSIYIDNAIEATLSSKNKEILVQLYLNSENKLEIAIANTFKGEVDLSKIDLKGYSTKGEGRGYGLSLAHEILGRNKNIENIRKLDKNMFTQIIIINKKI